MAPSATRQVASFVWNHPANRGRRGRALTRAAYFQIRARVSSRPYETRIGDHSKLIATRAASNSVKAVYANPPEWPEMEVWHRFLRPGRLFIDIGANVGTYTIYALDRGASVVSIEPDTVGAARLRANLDLNGYECTIIEAAAADDSDGRHLTRGLDSKNHLVASLDAAAADEVPSVVLDDVIGDRVACAKIDVEGAELAVLRGATKALREKRLELLQLEWNNLSERYFGIERSEIAEFLEGFGYDVFVPDRDGGLVPASRPPIGRDVFAKPSEKGVSAGG